MLPFYQALFFYRNFLSAFRKSLIYLTCLLCFVFAAQSGVYAQISLTPPAFPSNTVTVSENFNGTGTGLPANWKLTNAVTLTTNNTTAIGNNVLNFASTTTSPALVNGMAIGGPAASNIPAGATISSFNATTVTMSANALALVPSGGTVCFSNGSTPTWGSTANVTSANFQTAVGSATGGSYAYTSSVASDRAFGFQGSTSFINPHSVMAHYRNNTGATLTDLSISFTAERYRINTPSAASLTFFYSTDGNTWTPVPSGDIAASNFPTGTAAFTFADGSQTKVSRTATITGLSIPTGVTGNFYLRWNIITTNANSQGIAIDDISTTATLLNCSSPSAQPTALTFPSVGTGQISGSFTAAAGPPNGYLVVRYPAGNTPTAPSNGTIYSTGNALGTGIVVSAAAGTTFTASGLATGTNYDFYVYAYNSTFCIGPVYRTASPLIGTQATGSCAGINPTIQIDPAGANVFGTTYTSITNALNDLSGCAISQPIVIELQSNYVSTGETFPIALGAISGASATNTITIRPASGASNLSITGNSVGAPILNINGGSWWRIDGRAGGLGTTQNLTVQNTDNTVAFSSAIRLIGGAKNNIITYCKVRSANVGVAGGSISISDGTLTDGNDNNTISFNDVFASTGGIPNVGIGCVGVNTANNGNTISNNNIYDFFNPAGNTYGVYVSDLNTNLTISGNSIYQTASRTLTGGAADRIYAPIGVSPTTASTVTGLSITGNFIGGTAPNCGGSAMTIQDNGAATLVLRAIFVQAGTSPATSIQGNTLRNIAFTSSSSSANQSLISAVTGAFNIGNISGNTLGSATGTGSVTFTQSTASTTPRFSGILAGTGTPGAMNISNNSIGSFTVSNSSSGRVEMAGIYGQGAVSYTIGSNQIGGATTASLSNATSSDSWGIYLSSATTTNSISDNTVQNLSSGPGRMLGIRTEGGVNTISNNIIRNNTSASTALTGCIGIWDNSTSAGQTISGNTIHSLSNTDLTAASTAQGIYYQGPTTGTNVIERNFVHSLRLSTSSTAGALYGIRVLVGIFPINIQNNMVRLGVDAAGADITTGYSIFGIANASTGITNHYFNTAYVGGSGVTGTTSSTYALFASGSGNTRAFQNNILANTRDGGTTGNHYAFQIGGVGVNPVGLTMNNNLYQTTGSNGFVGSYNASNLLDLTAVQSNIGQNANSYVCDPQLINPDGNASTVDLHILAPPVKTLIEANGLVISGITTDFDGQTRSALTPTDIGADAGNFTQQTGGCNTTLIWNGSVNSSWGTPGNWTPAQAPSVTTPVIIPGGVTPQPSITGTVNALSVSLTGNAAPTLGLGAILNIKGDASGVASAAFKGVGKVVFNGNTQQNVTGNFVVSNVDFANTTAQGVVVANGAILRVEPNATSGTGLVTFINNSRLTNNGKFVLGSNTLATAKIGIMPTTTFITGTFTMERYLPYTTQGGSWYFLGSPFMNNNFTDYADNFRVTGLPSGFAMQGGGIISNTAPERSTIFKFDEPSSNIRVDTVQKQGWLIPGNENVIPGKGYRIFVNSSFNSSHKVDNTGNLVSGDFSFGNVTKTALSGCIPAAFPCDEANIRGWNLLANPYPCDINWDANTFWTKPSGANMADAWYRYHASANAYGVYTLGSYAGTTPIPVNPNIIPSSQAFFVRVLTTGSYPIGVKEGAKVTNSAGQFLRINTVVDKMRIHLSKNQDPNAYGYDAVVRFLNDATDGYDAQFDFENLPGAGFSITVPVDNLKMAIASFAPIGDMKIVPLSFSAANNFGPFQFKFSELENLLEKNTIYLKDNLTGTITQLSNDFIYDFESSATDGMMENRFELIFNSNAITSGKSSVKESQVLVYPNPSNALKGSEITVSGLDSKIAELEIVDAMGKTVAKDKLGISGVGTASYILKHGISSGLYTLKIQTQNKTTTHKWLVK